jgi:hypothetical protein
VTWGHETSHGIHAYIRNNKNDTGKKANGFYLLSGNYAIVLEPKLRIRDIRQYVPTEMRLGRYELYFVQQSAWDDTPLYIFDEWNAYVNGGATAIDLHKQGKWKAGKRDAVVGVIEFSVYALAVGQAVKEKDSQYFNDYEQFRHFMKFNLERSLEIFKYGRKVPEFSGYGQDEYFEKFKTSPQAAQLRKFATDTFGADWCQRVLEI